MTVKSLARDITTNTIDKSVNYLLARRQGLSQFPNLEDYILSNDASKPYSLNGFEHHFVHVRSRIARKLWARGIYIGVSVIDSLLFELIAHTATTDPVLTILEHIQKLGLHRPGFILFPLHSIGVHGAGAFHAFTQSRVQFVLNPYGLVITPQTNSFDKTVDFLNSAAQILGVKQKVPKELIEHWRRSRSTTWLERNPLLVMRVRNFPGDYYENEFLLTGKLSLASALILLLATIQQQVEKDTEDALLSSSRVNNWQTLDIHHYFVFYPRPGRAQRLGGHCVPMHTRSITSSELASVPVDLDPRHWKRRTRLLTRFCNAIEILEAEYTSYAQKNGKNTLRNRVGRKLYNSLVFFRRSFRDDNKSMDAVVNLAAAFEILLIDIYAPGVGKRIAKRLRLALRKVRGARKLVASLDNLYKARSAYIHAGESQHDVDIRVARIAFAWAFLGVVERLHKLPTTSNQPIYDILR